MTEEQAQHYKGTRPHIVCNARYTVKRDLDLPNRYANLFHGRRKLEKGVYNFRFINSDFAKGHLAHEFQEHYAGAIIVLFQSAEYVWF